MEVSESCGTLNPNLCRQRPQRIIMQYTGNDCTAGSISQPGDKFSCVDTGSDILGDAIIQAVGSRDGEEYFSGEVSVGDVISFSAQEDALASDIKFQVFSKAGSLLQEVIFHSSCSQQLTCYDDYGALTLLGVENASQGLLLCSTDEVKTFTFDIAADGFSDTYTSMEISKLVLSTDFTTPPDEVINDLQGVTLTEVMPTASFTVTPENQIGPNLSVERRVIDAAMTKTESWA